VRVFGRLLPKEGNFFELFNEHGTHIAVGARAFLAMVQNYADRTLREKYAAEVDAPNVRPTRSRPKSPAAAPHLHHADRPRADPRADQRDGRHPRPAAGLQRGDVAVRRAALARTCCA
jgi:hypothetical protein